MNLPKFAWWWFLAAAVSARAAATAPLPGPRGVWLGQDGHDACQTATELKPNDIQDLHLRLEGLPAAEELKGGLIRRDGGGEWAFGSQGGRWTWKAQLLREPQATSADLFMEPSHHEESFRVEVELDYRSGRVDRFSVPCGRSNPNLFMPAAQLKASWAGQGAYDWTGLGPAVGPDGFEDARIELAGLSTKLEIKSLAIEVTNHTGWEYGLNPSRRWNAELFREDKDRSRGNLFFSPDQDLTGQTMTLRITYANERSNSTTLVAGATDPRRAMPKPPEIRLSPQRLAVEWLGQDGKDAGGRGDLHVVVESLPTERAIVGAALSDQVGGYWIFRRDAKAVFHPAANSGDPPSLPLIVWRTNGATKADLFFQPYRDEAGTPMVLRVLLEDGTTIVHRFMGKACDPYLRGPLPSAERVEARPGDDLNAFAEKFGAIQLTKGRYVLSQPLVLNRPITITGEKDSVLVFAQPTNEPAWAGAIFIAAGNVTLQGFTVRFADGFRWAVSGPGGAALVRAVDQPGSRDPKVNIVLRYLDLESSSVMPPPDPKQPIEAPYLARLGGATSGKITGNRFRGGTVDVANGPWLIADNVHDGTLPGTVAWDAFGGHWLHDFTLERNRVRAASPSGKIWRFISMNQLGQHVVIRDNDVSGVGMRDDDPMPNPNAPEILLTESYRLYFEGKPAGISNGGWVLQIPMVMYGAVRAGSIVSILSGAHAGKYFTIAQPITPTAFLMAEPLPAGDYAISVAHGFVDNVIERNRIDVRGGKSAVVVLAGNHWNLRLLNNHLLGGGDSLLVQSTPTENPYIWGWSHTPFLGFLGEGNLHEDSRRGVFLDVYSNRHNKTTSGRTYMTGIYRNNTNLWSSMALAQVKPEPDAVRMGVQSGEDPGQLQIKVDGNRHRGDAPANLLIRHATINGEPVQERLVPLPAATK